MCWVSSDIVRGWDDLFNKCGEHLNSLSAMKLSPYYRGTLSLDGLSSLTHVVFEEDAVSWEDRLNRIHVLFGQSVSLNRSARHPANQL